MQLVPYYAPPLIGGDIKRCFCLTSVCLTFDVCLSRTSGLSREQRGLGRPKLAQRYPTSHVTRTPLSRSKVKVTRPLCSPPCWRVRRLQRWAWEFVGRGKLLLRCRLLGGAKRFGAHGGGEGRGHTVAAARLQLVCTVIDLVSYCCLIVILRTNHLW